MNAEYIWWLVILAMVGVGVVAYLAMGPVPEIPAAGTPDERPGGATASAGAISSAGPAVDAQSSPVSTTEPGPGAPSSTSETP